MGNEIREKLDAKPLFVSAFILRPASQHQLPTAATEVQFCVHELKIILFQNSVFSVEVRVGSVASEQVDRDGFRSQHPEPVQQHGDQGRLSL